MSTKDAFLVEAKRLYDLAIGVHWLRRGSKIPVKSGWNGPQRDSWDTLRAEYRQGYGLGIRLGEASKLGEGYLAVIDLDVRSQDPRYLAEAIAVIDRLFPGVRTSAPQVATGRGFGSAHFYVLTKTPVPSKKLDRSNEQIKVYSPTSEITRKQQKGGANEGLTKEELNNGFRIKCAWEVELMCTGKQVVAPPTRHPDMGSPYEWVRRF